MVGKTANFLTDTKSQARGAVAMSNSVTEDRFYPLQYHYRSNYFPLTLF